MEAKDIKNLVHMSKAFDMAEINLGKNFLEGGPFGAVIIKDGKQVGKGRNKVLVSNDPTAHAEVMAIRDACRNLETIDLTGCVLYTSCFPCPMCLSAIMWANIDTVYYGNTKEDAANIGFRDDFIYKFIEEYSALGQYMRTNNTLNLTQIGRELTITTFEEFDKISKLEDVLY